MRIAACAETDIDALEHHLPSGRNDVHAYHFARQQAGEVAYLIAWVDDIPVGSGVVTWGGFLQDAPRAAFPDCPEIGFLGVAEKWRGQGIGSALIRHAEDLIRGRGFQRAGLGVGLDNPAAARLYERLGYRDTGIACESRYTWYDDQGVGHEMVETDRYFVRSW